MPDFVSAYTDDDANTVVTVTEAFAQAKGLTILKSDEPTDRYGRPRGPREVHRSSASKATSTTKPNGGSAASKVEEN